MKTLVVEDSTTLRESVTIALRCSGFIVDATGDGSDALWRVTDGTYDCVILDIMLPGLDGLSILRGIREREVRTRVLLLTARDAVEDRVAGLNAGADDYLVKPFALPELVARVQSLCRRGYHREEPVLRCGPMTLDTISRCASFGGQNITLAPREYAVLEYLLRRSGEVISRREIEDHIYDANAEQFSNVVDTVIYALRKKLPDGPTAPKILTRRGQGYVLER